MCYRTTALLACPGAVLACRGPVRPLPQTDARSVAFCLVIRTHDSVSAIPPWPDYPSHWDCINDQPFDPLPATVSVNSDGVAGILTSASAVVAVDYRSSGVEDGYCTGYYLMDSLPWNTPLVSEFWRERGKAQDALFDTISPAGAVRITLNGGIPRWLGPAEVLVLQDSTDDTIRAVNIPPPGIITIERHHRTDSIRNCSFLDVDSGN